MGRKNAVKRFVTVKNQFDGKEWQHSVPAYIGKISVGDVVVVGDMRHGALALGEVVSIDPCAIHRNDNVWPIVDKVKTNRWQKFIDDSSTKSQLMYDMAKRQEELDALETYGASAKFDSVMGSLLDEYRRRL